jgi:hypothetical protein
VTFTRLRTRHWAWNWESAKTYFLPRITHELNRGFPLIAEVVASPDHFVVITGVTTFGVKLSLKNPVWYTYANGTRVLTRHPYATSGDFLINDPAQHKNENEKGVRLFESKKYVMTHSGVPPSGGI